MTSYESLYAVNADRVICAPHVADVMTEDERSRLTALETMRRDLEKTLLRRMLLTDGARRDDLSLEYLAVLAYRRSQRALEQIVADDVLDRLGLPVPLPLRPHYNSDGGCVGTVAAFAEDALLPNLTVGQMAAALRLEWLRPLHRALNRLRSSEDRAPRLNIDYAYWLAPRDADFTSVCCVTAHLVGPLRAPPNNALEGLNAPHCVLKLTRCGDYAVLQAFRRDAYRADHESHRFLPPGWSTVELLLPDATLAGHTGPERYAPAPDARARRTFSGHVSLLEPADVERNEQENVAWRL